MKTIYLTTGFLLISFVGLAQNLLNNPKSVVYDSSNHRYFVSNWEDGNIVAIDQTGQQQIFNDTLQHVAGLHINNILAIPNFNSNSVDLIPLASVIQVPGDQPTIQAGINVAETGDTVLVAPGTYYENINFKRKNIVVASHYIINNTIVNNESALKGGAMYLWSTQLNARNNIIWGNTQASEVPIYLYGVATAEITYTDIEGGYTGEGNIDLPPQFADTNFILVTTSPCIDTGNPNVQFDDPEDPENPGQALWPSHGQLRNDMGAYGGPFRNNLADLTTGINIYDKNKTKFINLKLRKSY